MKFKRIAALALSAVMAATMFTGCGSKTGGAASGKTVISVWRDCFNLETVDQAQQQKVEDAVNEYIKDKIDVQIKMVQFPNAEYKDKANNALSTSEINLLWTAAWMETIGTNDLVANNAVYDITDLLPGSKVYESMDANQWEASKYNGKNYFIPVYKDNVEGYDLMTRKALVDEYGWDISSIKKLEDLEPMLAQCKEAGLKYPFLVQKTPMFFRWYLDSFDFFMGNSLFAVDKRTNEVVNPIQTTEYKEFCELMAKWADLGYISEEESQKITPETTTQTQDWGFSWWTDVPVNAQANDRYGQEVVLTPMTKRWAHATSALGSCYAITATSTKEQAQACIDFMGLLYTDNTLANLWTFGIEGEDYTMEDGKVKQTSTKYNHDMWSSVSATIITPEVSEPDGFGDLYKAFNGGAEVSCASQFHYDKEKVKAEFGACGDVFNEYGYLLETGGIAAADVESKIADYQKALDAAGYQTVLAEFQEQYNAIK